MAPRDTQVCCCGASTWTTVFAGLQILGGAILMIAGLVIAFSTDKSGQTRAGPLDGMGAIIGILLFVALFNIILGTFLLTGTKTGQICLLWTWWIVEVIETWLGSGAFMVSCVNADIPNAVSVVAATVVQIFAICVVKQRIKDVKMTLTASDEVEFPVIKNTTV